MRIARIVTVTAALAATTAGAGVAASAAVAAPQQAAAAVRQFEGTVVSVNRSNRTFRLRDSERGTVRIAVTGSTRFERVSGFAGLRTGMTRIEVRVRNRKSGGAWVALEVERSGGGGQHGGNDDSGSDDNGGRGRGSDD